MAEKYMMIFHGGHAHTGSPEEMQNDMQKWLKWIDGLRGKGLYVSGEPLEPRGKMLSGQNGVNVIDGPFAESKETVGGFVIVNANDENHAIELSRGCPIFEYGGSLQLRPVMAVPK